jgi:hypothetical protein
MAKEWSLFLVREDGSLQYIGSEQAGLNHVTDQCTMVMKLKELEYSEED